MTLARFKDLCLDANDVEKVASFWAQLLGHELVRLDNGDAKLVGEPLIWVNRVPEPKTAKTRLHLDVTLASDDPRELVALGATVLAEPTPATPWWVLADPEGVEFCAFPPAGGTSGTGAPAG